MKGSLKKNPNVCSEKKYTKCSSVLLLRLLYFFSEQTLEVRTLNLVIKIAGRDLGKYVL